MPDHTTDGPPCASPLEKRRSVKLSEQEENEYLDRYFAGDRVESLADRFGVSRYYYKCLLERRGLSPRPHVDRSRSNVEPRRPRATKYPPHLATAAIDRYLAGESPKTICADLGVSLGFLDLARKKRGITPISRVVSAFLVTEECLVDFDDVSVWVVINDDQRFLIDRQDVHLVLHGYVRIFAANKLTSYVSVGTESGLRDFLHRLILPTDDGFEVDHKNRDGLDCRRSNLRQATRSQNCANRRTSGSQRTPYRGLSRNHGRWSARLTAHGVTHYLGTFDTAEEAARARDAAALKHFGEFAVLNFPLEEVAS